MIRSSQSWLDCDWFRLMFLLYFWYSDDPMMKMYLMASKSHWKTVNKRFISLHFYRTKWIQFAENLIQQQHIHTKYHWICLSWKLISISRLSPQNVQMNGNEEKSNYIGIIMSLFFHVIFSRSVSNRHHFSSVSAVNRRVLAKRQLIYEG